MFCCKYIPGRRRAAHRTVDRLYENGFTLRQLLQFWRNYSREAQEHVCSACGKIIDGTPAQQNDQVFHLGCVNLDAPWHKKVVVDQFTTTTEIVRDIIIPETAAAGVGAYMDIMPGGRHEPDVLVSHWWGARFYDDIVCISKYATCSSGDDLTTFIDRSYLEAIDPDLDKTFWMCIFAVNQHVSICGDCWGCRAGAKWTSSLYASNPCQICGKEKFNPCNCGSLKYPTGHEQCEVDKFHLVMGRIRKLLVALDPGLIMLTRIWCISEIGTCLAEKYDISFGTSGTVKPHQLEGGVHVRDIQDCDASNPEDKIRILDEINKQVGIARYNELVRVDVQCCILSYMREMPSRPGVSPCCSEAGSCKVTADCCP
eukprot:TRINITY_DN31750_c0_g1_i12.p1 TRINITY_DN31750_c0_g1~~TRINITY_DN31750_c0_g1_i12.p1  ORF type:complete len:370 (+),score=36.00 TRINITY_DN31750_c0_g1_i12:18-1127(+)